MSDEKLYDVACIVTTHASNPESAVANARRSLGMAGMGRPYIARERQEKVPLTDEQKELVIKWCLSPERAKGILEDSDSHEFDHVENFSAARRHIEAYIDQLREQLL